nr:PREDICTED: uncharacterized protein LOC102360490 isoform X1 [Latimeria chalumnae]|eukprot:XP_014344861.1 PREDICTED: uncharacterized protein LOC102360490 isoform X1 [Latimeria chalumnae]
MNIDIYFFGGRGGVMFLPQSCRSGECDTGWSLQAFVYFNSLPFNFAGLLYTVASGRVKAKSISISQKFHLKVDLESRKLVMKKSWDRPENKVYNHLRTGVTLELRCTRKTDKQWRNRKTENAENIQTGERDRREETNRGAAEERQTGKTA